MNSRLPSSPLPANLAASMSSAPGHPMPPTATVVTLHLPGGIPLSFCRIPAGSFRMGSRGYSDAEEPVHEVRIGSTFWLGQTPVTQEQFAAWTRSAGIKHQNEGAETSGNHPAENLNWGQANGFCAWLGEVVRLAPEMISDGMSLFCLPTEAEWEYACRAGTVTEYHTGDGEAALEEAGWYDKNSGDSTHPVGLKAPNPWGLYDLHGNVWEWCHDLWAEEAYRGRWDGIMDPGSEARRANWVVGGTPLAEDYRKRVVRGGSFFDGARRVRSAYRGWRRAVNRNWFYGFRVCLVGGPAGQQAGPAGAESGLETDGAGADGAGVDPLRGAAFTGAAGRNFLKKPGLPDS